MRTGLVEEGERDSAATVTCRRLDGRDIPTVGGRVLHGAVEQADAVLAVAARVRIVLGVVVTPLADGRERVEAALRLRGSRDELCSVLVTLLAELPQDVVAEALADHAVRVAERRR